MSSNQKEEKTVELRVEIVKQQNNENLYFFKKFEDGKIKVAYAPVSLEMAIVNASLFLNGFEPMHASRFEIQS